MSEQHSESASGELSGAVKLSVIVFVGSIALVVGILLLAKFAIGTRPLGTGNENANSPEAIAARIGPAVTLAVDPTKGPVAGAPTAPATNASKATPVAVAAVVIPAAIPAANAAKPAGGEGIYKTACAACHSAGVAGAPKSGDKAAWAPRIAQGKDTLYKHAIGGFQGKGGVMPAKGGNTTLADADVKSAVDYMIALNK
jgi:cytochrome c5